MATDAAYHDTRKGEYSNMTKRTRLLGFVLLLLILLAGVTAAGGEGMLFEMDTWETNTFFENLDLLHVEAPYYLLGNMPPVDLDAMRRNPNYYGIWISGWLSYKTSSRGRDVMAVDLHNVPPWMHFYEEAAQEEYEYLYPGMERISLYAYIDSDIPLSDVDAALKGLSGVATIDILHDDYTDTSKIAIGFSGITQRVFSQDEVVARITKCEYVGPEGRDGYNVYAYSNRKIEAGTVSYWMITGEVVSPSPILMARFDYSRDEIDIVYLDDTNLPSSFSLFVVIPYDEVEPTYDEAVAYLQSASLSCFYTLEPYMIMPFHHGDFGPYYYIPFDLSPLLNQSP